MELISLRDVIDLYKLLSEKDLYGLYESAFKETKKNFPSIHGSTEAQLSQINDEKIRSLFKNTEKYLYLDDLKKEILTTYRREMGNEIPKEVLKNLLDCLFKNLDKKVRSTNKVRKELIYLYARDTHRRMVELSHKSSLHVLLISVLGILVVFSLTSHYNVQNLSPLNFILSSISQGLAATFALVFTITLVVTQILTRYSIRSASVIFSLWTVFIMFIFAVGIIVPLIAMKWQSEQLLDLCIMWAGACIFLLIPYFFFLKERLSPSWHIKSFLQKVDSKYIEDLKRVHEMRTSRSKEYISYELDRTGAKYYFEIQDDPLLIVQQIMMRSLREGDYETFISALAMIRNRYELTVKRDNSRYLGFQFLNALIRLGKELTRENQDFLLLRLCFVLRDITVFNAKWKFPNLSIRVSSLMGEYLEIAYVREDFTTIRLEIQKVIDDICLEYVRSGSESDFLNQVAEIERRREKIVEHISPQEVFDFMDFIRFLAAIALSGGLTFLKVVEILTNCMREVGFQSAEKHLKLPREWEGIERRLSEWSAIHLERIKDGLLDVMNKAQKDERDSKELPMAEKVVSRIGDYVLEIRKRRIKMREKSGYESKD